MTNPNYTANLPQEIKSALLVTVKKANPELARELLNFVGEMLYLAIRYSDSELYTSFLDIPGFVYEKVTERRDSVELMPIAFAPYRTSIPSRILRDKLGIELYNLGSDAELTVNEQVVDYFYYQTFLRFNSLIQNAVTGIDAEGFGIFKNDLDEAYRSAMLHYNEALRERAKSKEAEAENSDAKETKPRGIFMVGQKLEIYYRRSLLGLKYWINYLLYREILPVNVWQDITTQIRVPIRESNDIVNDLIFATNGDNENYFNWSTWSIPIRPGEQRSQTLATSGWMKVGFMIQSLIEGRFHLNTEKLSAADVSYLNSIRDRLSEIGNELVEKHEKWHKIFDIQSQSGLRERVKVVLSLFEQFRPKPLSIEQFILSSPLSEEKITAFKNRAGMAWRRQARIRNLFIQSGIIKEIPTDSRELTRIGKRNLLINGKPAFIDDERMIQAYGNEDLAAMIGRAEDHLLFHRIENSEHEIIEGNIAPLLLDQAISKLRSKGIEPDMILTAPDFSYKDQALKDSDKFEEYLNLINDGQKYAAFNIGQYDGLPIYTAFSDYLDTRFIVCNFKNSFTLEYKTNDEWYDKVLTLDIRELSQEDIDERLPAMRKNWGDDANGRIQTDEQLIDLLKSSVIFDAWTVLDFSIKDTKQFIVAELTNDTIT